MTTQPDIAEESFQIASSLRTVFLGIGNIVQGELSAAECDRVFQDAMNERGAPRKYLFHKSSSWVVTGLVQEGRPGWIGLKIVWTREETPVRFGDALAEMSRAARV